MLWLGVHFLRDDRLGGHIKVLGPSVMSYEMAVNALCVEYCIPYLLDSRRSPLPFRVNL